MRQCISTVLVNEFLNLSCQRANKLVYTPLVIGNYKKSQLHEEIKHLGWDWGYKPVMPAIDVKKLDDIYELKANLIYTENYRQEGLTQ